MSLAAAPFARRYLSETVRSPQFKKLRNRRRSVSLEMIVRVRVDQHASLHDLIAEIDRTAEFRSSIIGPR
jgi:hypothetical protein